MIFGDFGGLKLPDICLTGEEKPPTGFPEAWWRFDLSTLCVCVCVCYIYGSKGDWDFRISDPVDL